MTTEACAKISACTVVLTSILLTVAAGPAAGASHGVLPPGDVLKCALALARNEREARRILLTRLPMLQNARLGGHTGGNLLLSMMQQYTDDFLSAVDGLSALLGCQAIAILPEEMSRERFDWLRGIGAEIIATPGCESNVKEIFDAVADLRANNSDVFIFNQFEEFGNYVWHYGVTGHAVEEAFNFFVHGADGLDLPVLVH